MFKREFPYIPTHRKMNCGDRITTLLKHFYHFIFISFFKAILTLTEPFCVCTRCVFLHWWSSIHILSKYSPTGIWWETLFHVSIAQHKYPIKKFFYPCVREWNYMVLCCPCDEVGIFEVDVRTLYVCVFVTQFLCKQMYNI